MCRFTEDAHLSTLAAKRNRPSFSFVSYLLPPILFPSRLSIFIESLVFLSLCFRALFRAIRCPGRRGEIINETTESRDLSSVRGIDRADPFDGAPLPLPSPFLVDFYLPRYSTSVPCSLKIPAPPPGISGYYRRPS